MMRRQHVLSIGSCSVSPPIWLPADFAPYTAQEVTRSRPDKGERRESPPRCNLAEMRRRGLLDAGYISAAANVTDQPPVATR